MRLIVGGLGGALASEFVQLSDVVPNCPCGRLSHIGICVLEFHLPVSRMLVARQNVVTDFRVGPKCSQTIVWRVQPERAILYQAISELGENRPNSGQIGDAGDLNTINSNTINAGGDGLQ